MLVNVYIKACGYRNESYSISEAWEEKVRKHQNSRYNNLHLYNTLQKWCSDVQQHNLDCIVFYPCGVNYNVFGCIQYWMCNTYHPPCRKKEQFSIIQLYSFKTTSMSKKWFNIDCKLLTVKQPKFDTLLSCLTNDCNLRTSRQYSMWTHTYVTESSNTTLNVVLLTTGKRCTLR